MAFTISHTDGSTLVTIPDGTEDTSSSLTLYGKNFSGYGLSMNENFVRLLENSSNVTPPTSPLVGQLWWDAPNKRLSAFDGTAWRLISDPAPSDIPPSASYEGELWWDTANLQLKVFNGSNWVLVGPSYSTEQGITGTVVETVLDTFMSKHTIIQLMIGGSIVAVISKDPTFNTNQVTGFYTIASGFNLPNANGILTGTSSNSLSLGGVQAGNYMRSDVATSTNYMLSIKNDSGLSIGSYGSFKLDINDNNIRFMCKQQGEDMLFSVNVNSVDTTAMSISAQTGLVEVMGDPTSDLGVATKQYIDRRIEQETALSLKTDGSELINGNILPETSSGSPVHSLGSLTNSFTSVYSSSTVSANTGFAENYLSDAEYDAGTVLDFGGDQEVTIGHTAGSTKIAGIVATRYSHLTNSTLVGEFVTPLIIHGRCPVKVLGQVNKGDILVSGGNGYAVVSNSPAVGSILGRAVGSFHGSTGVVEISVSRN